MKMEQLHLEISQVAVLLRVKLVDDEVDEVEVDEVEGEVDLVEVEVDEVQGEVDLVEDDLLQLQLQLRVLLQ